MKQKQKEKRVWRRFVSILSCVVVFCTTYALILPAVTMERDDIVYYCDKEEHQHTDECYESSEPLCGLEESESANHVHDENCYEEQEVLDCVEEHEHTQECYKTESVLICDKEEGEAHQHSAKCYLSADPLCGQEVHTHSRECESNKELKETKEDWEKSIPATLKEQTSERMVQIALSQKDYKEVKENFEIDEDGHEHCYTRYGEWYGKPYEDWNVMFISFVLKYAGIKNEQIPYGHDWNEWIEDLTKKQLLAPEDYEPKDGDFIFIKDLPDENIPDKEIKNYAGIITDAKNKKVVIGDLNGQVKEITLDDKEYETNAYVEIKNDEQNSEEEKTKPEEDQGDIDNDINEEQPAEEEPVEEEQETIDYQLPENFTIENEDFTLVLTPRVFNDEDEQEETNTEETENEGEEQGLRIKQFSLSENMQEKIDEESQLTKEELEQIEQEKEQEKKEEEEKPVLTVQLEKIDEQTETNEEEQAEIEQLREQSLENVEQENLLDLSFYKLRFFANDQEVDLGDQKFDAELTPTQDYLNRNAPRLDYSEAVEEIEKGVEVNVIQTTSSTLSNTLVEEETDNLDSMFYGEDKKELSPILFSVLANEMFAKSATEPLNAQFTVQYYAYITKYKEAENITANNTSGNKNVPVIDMTNGIPSSFPALTDEQVKIYDIKGGSAGGSIDTVTSTIPEILFRDHSYHYHNAPNLFYFDRLANQASFKLTEIWILKEDKESTSTNKDDWNQCSPDKVYFTNKPSLKGQTTKDGKKYIFIDDGKTVIRLIYEEEQETELVSEANFYDYDITNPEKNKPNENYYPTQDKVGKDGKAYGINSANNYKENGLPKLAFGNANTGIMSMYDNKFGSVNLNRRASDTASTTNSSKMNSYLQRAGGGESAYPIFGLVGEKLNSNGTLNYNVDTPNLFNEGGALGKTAYENQNLTFKRRGNMYTLTSATVGEHTASNLDTLFHPQYNNKNVHNHIWTNEFWPMDGVTNDDPKTGNNKQYHQGILDKDGKETGRKNYPLSDNLYKLHNNMFGMYYQVEFELDEDYMGPLEYFFFGDDDLWVYLDNELIVDIGGVHSSYGAYVDLSTKLRANKESTSSGEHEESKKEKHTLTIFYTERGLSGSTCYMEFNLPSVTSVEQPQETGKLRVYKETEDDDKTTEYEFTVTLEGEAGMRDYVYVKNGLDNTSDTGLIEHDPHTYTSGATILLKSGESFEISYLPHGTKYIVKEVNVDGSTTVYTGATNSSYSDAIRDGTSAVVTSGPDPYKDIAKGNVREVYFKNVRSYQLPETGSLGIDPPFIAGSASVMTTSFYALTIQRKKRRKKK